MIAGMPAAAAAALVEPPTARPGPGRLADDVAEPVGGGQLAGPVLGGARVVQRERLERLDHVAGVRVHQGIGARDELRKRVVCEPVGERPGRVAGEAAVEVLAVVGNDERAAGAERRQVQHRHRDDAAAQFRSSSWPAHFRTPSIDAYSQPCTPAMTVSRGPSPAPVSSMTGTSRPASVSA